MKENIVLNEKPETNIFEYKIETKNLYLKKQENDKGLLVYDKNTNKIIGTIEAPFLVDADGKEDYKSVEYKLEKDGENEVLKVMIILKTKPQSIRLQLILQWYGCLTT